jgi:hypothetical protein
MPAPAVNLMRHSRQRIPKMRQTASVGELTRLVTWILVRRSVRPDNEKDWGRYQCYADGKDLALLALRGGLAQAAADAPSEYRSIAHSPLTAGFR